ncbi:MAG TPA: RNA polymerase sigma factor RpoH [Rickettsiales bacterium]|nr:RNA polymerase sigma factor RpoH [Rickettsiales bacterium]
MTNQLPVVSAEGGLRRYLAEIRKIPLLTEAEEYMLAKRFQEHNDIAAAHRLVTSHLRLVAKIAGQYRGYGLPSSELVAEGNIGLMQAVRRFDPDRGFRLATYAMWWIKAAIQEYILRSWSLVKLGSSAAQKKLFFGLRKVKNSMRQAANELTHGVLTPEEVTEIAAKMGVSEEDVIDMDTRMSAHDQHLNSKVGGDSDDEWQDMLAEPSDNQETLLAESQERKLNSRMLESAIAKLSEREQDIIRERHLKEQPATLEDLSKTYNISRERVRQIESRAIEKLQKEMLLLTQEKTAA